MRTGMMLGLMLLSSSALAGRCSAVAPFVESLQAAPVVVQATVVRAAQTLVAPSFIEVRVMSTLKGRVGTSLIKVFDSVTSAPIQSASGLPVGSRWVMALQPTGDGAGQHFTFTPCANAYGALIGPFVFANAYGNQDVLTPLSEVRAALRPR